MRNPGEFRPYYGTVRNGDGEVLDPKEVSASEDDIREAIRQWDADGRYEWRIIERTSTWTEREIEVSR